MISRGDFLKTTTYLPAVHELGSTWSPSNYDYGLADFVIEKLSGVSYGEFLEQRLFKPLGLDRTTDDVRPHMDNIAEAYLYVGDTPHHIGKPQVGDGTIMVGAMGLKSSTKDLLMFAKHLMQAVAEQSQNKTTSTPDSPFAQAPNLFKPHVVISKKKDGTPKEDFALGWVGTHLPSTMSQVSINEGLVKQYPMIGKGLQDSPLVLYTAGSVIGYLTSVTLLPESKSAIVVMSNTLSNQDLRDWVSMLLLEALLDVKERVNFIPFAHEAAETWSRQFVDGWIL